MPPVNSNHQPPAGVTPLLLHIASAKFPQFVRTLLAMVKQMYWTQTSLSCFWMLYTVQCHLFSHRNLCVQSVRKHLREGQTRVHFIELGTVRGYIREGEW